VIHQPAVKAVVGGVCQGEFRGEDGHAGGRSAVFPAAIVPARASGGAAGR